MHQRQSRGKHLPEAAALRRRAAGRTLRVLPVRRALREALGVPPRRRLRTRAGMWADRSV